MRTVRRFLVERHSVGLVSAAVMMVALAACSGGDSGDDSGNDDAGGSGPSASAGPAAGASSGGAVASASPGAAAPDLPVLAGRDAKVKELPIRVDVNELRVEGQVTRLTFTARNLAVAVPGKAPDRWQIGQFFSDGLFQKKVGAAPDDSFSVDGVYLLDSAGAKRYLAARNASQGCVCSGDLSATFVSPGSGVVLTSVFAALPAGVDAVDVVVPGFGSFNQVAVSR